MRKLKNIVSNVPSSIDSPSTRIFSGLEEVKNVYRSMLALNSEEIIYTFIDRESIGPELSKWLKEEFEPKRISQKISQQSFITITKIPKERWGYIQYDKESYSAKYLVDPIDKPFVGEVSVFGNSVAFINFSSKRDD